MTRGEFEREILPVSRNLYRFAFRHLSSREEAEDAVQEVFIKLWKMKDRLIQYNSVNALAMTMTRNYCLDMLRKRGREFGENYLPVNTRASGQDPHEESENKESVRVLMKIINTLPENLRRAILMRDIDGYDYNEIAEILEINISTLRVNIFRARKIVRNKFIELNYEPAGIKTTS